MRFRFERRKDAIKTLAMILFLEPDLDGVTETSSAHN
jgi:hypothetical protein